MGYAVNCYTRRTVRVVIDKDGEVDPVDTAYRIGTFRHADHTQYRIFFCRGCRRPFTANAGEETVHDCPSSN